MGQKTNPTIFRLGVIKNWKTEFFEKKQHEFPLYTFKDLEIKAYITRFLEVRGILLHDYKQHYSNSTLNLYISYFILPGFVISKKDKSHRVTLINELGKEKIVKDVQEQVRLTEVSSKTLNEKISFFRTQNASDSYIIKKYLKEHSNNLDLLSKKLPFKTDRSYIQSSETESALGDLFKVLNLFTNNRFDIIINFCCVNKDLNFIKSTQKKSFLLLQKFKSTPFLKEGIELLFHVVYNKNSANLLAKFIALQLKKVKRHKFFLAFLKQSLSILSNSSLSKVQGIKIIVKGRLNGVPRAKHKIVTIGDIPVQSINTNVDYSQETVHNSNGSYGIKVWVIEKESNLKNVFTTKKNKI